MANYDSDNEGIPNADAIPFAVSPANAIQGAIDYRTSQGAKLYSKATSALDYDEPFDCTADSLFAFVKTLGNRSTAFEWNTPGVGIVQIRTKKSTDNDHQLAYQSVQGLCSGLRSGLPKLGRRRRYHERGRPNGPREQELQNHEEQGHMECPKRQ
jgi:hypothetical protein